MSVDELVHAMQSLNAEDAFRPRLTADQWRSITPYLAQRDLRTGEVLVTQGEVDRTLWLLGQGTLQVYGTALPPGTATTGGGGRIAILRAGAVVGEPSLFAELPRGANVEAMTPCVVWALRGARLDELAQRMPALAYEILRAAGAVMAQRMRANLARQTPFT
jgi:CRP/FNR family transcriptional regulator, cyclic AMP receptor protein